MGNTFTDGTPATGTIGLCTTTQVKDRIGITSNGDDTRIDTLIAAATEAFNARFRREFMPRVTEKRTVSVDGYLVDLGLWDLVSATSVKLHPEATTPTLLTAGTGYALWPVESDPLTGTYGLIKLASSVDITSTFRSEFGVAQLEIEGTWGIWSDVTEVPEDVNEAAIETVLSWLDRPTALITALEGGDPRGVEPAPAASWDIPTNAWRKMQPYARRRMVW